MPPGMGGLWNLGFGMSPMFPQVQMADSMGQANLYQEPTLPAQVQPSQGAQNPLDWGQILSMASGILNQPQEQGMPMLQAPGLLYPQMNIQPFQLAQPAGLFGLGRM